MLLSEFDFPFDPALVAERPVEPRDQARLLVLDRTEEELGHYQVADLPSLLLPGDLVVVNDTRVLPRRLIGRKRPGGGKADVVLLGDAGGGIWEALVKGASRPGQVIDFGAEASVQVLESGPDGVRLQECGTKPIRDILPTLGQMPLPPYIKRDPEALDAHWYQTVFARADGAIAAPTAGLHFTDSLVGRLQEHGIGLATVTLHVGPGTFRPVRVDTIEEHRMLPEWIEVSEETAATIMQSKSKGRIIAIGTTVVRTLETVTDERGVARPYRGLTNLLITPGYRFRMVDGLLTNFHLPRTTLLMLVSAFAGLERLRAAYAAAIAARYRFYSYGDAMLIR